MQPPVFPVVTPNPLKTAEGLDLTWSSDPFQTYQEVTADDEGSVYGDEEEEGTVVEA